MHEGWSGAAVGRAALAMARTLRSSPHRPPAPAALQGNWAPTAKKGRGGRGGRGAKAAKPQEPTEEELQQMQVGRDGIKQR